jgi:hypothetical protein
MVRIGIVLSVFWFIGFGGYVWFSSMQRLSDLYSLDLQACSAKFDRDQNSVNYEDCLDEATERYHSRFNTYKERIPQLLLLDFGIMAVGWLIALLGGVITRFIRRGFPTLK